MDSEKGRDRKNSRLLIVLLAIAVLSLILLPACGPAPSGGQGGGGDSGDTGDTIDSTEYPILDDLPATPSKYISITDDRTLILTAAGQTQTIAAVVRNTSDNSLDSSAAISFESSDPSVVTVTTNGVVEAQTSSVGSATITLTTENAFEVIVTVAIVDLAEGASFLSSNQITSYDGDAGTLTLATNLGFSVGDVVISGERAGVLARITGVISTDANAGTTTYSVVDARIGEAVDALNVEVVGPAIRATDSLENMEVVANRDGSLMVSPALLGFECETENGDGVSVDIVGSDLDYDFAIRPRFKFETSGLTVQSMELALNGNAKIDASTGTLTIASDLNTKVTCEHDFQAIPLAFVGILGPLGIASTATPSLGIEIEASADVGQISISGPSISTGATVTGGFSYDRSTGFEAIGRYARYGDGLSWGTYAGDVNAAFEAKIGPYLKIQIAASANLGTRSLAAFEFMELKAGGIAELQIAEPLDPLVQAYTGPQWDLKVTGSAGLQPLVDNVEAGIKPLLDYFEIEAEFPPEGFDAEITSFSRTLASSPKPKAEATRDFLTEMGLVASDAGSGSVRFVGFTTVNGVAAAAGRVVATADAEDDHAYARWRPGGTFSQVNEIRARAYESPFGDVGLPYAKDQGWAIDSDVFRRASVEIRESHDVVDPGESMTNFTGFSEDSIDEDIGTLRVTWNDGSRQQSEVVNRGPEDEDFPILFRHEPETAFGSAGLHFQEIRWETEGGDYIDDRSVPVFVGIDLPAAQGDNSLSPGFVTIYNHEDLNEDFIIDDLGRDPQVILYRGLTYVITNRSDVDFWIKRANTGSEEDALDSGDGVTNNGSTEPRRRITFEVPQDAPNVLYYRSDDHPDMNGTFLVRDLQ